MSASLGMAEGLEHEVAYPPVPSPGLRETVATVFRYRGRIMAALVIPPLVALALVLLLPKVYRAQSDILVKAGREYLAQTDGESAVTAPSSTKQEEINSEIALLGSRAVAEATIRTIGLETLYPEIAENPPASGSVMDAAVDAFGKDFTIEPVKLSNVISLAFDAPSPALAQRVLDTVVQLYIAKHTQVFAGSRAEGYGDSLAQALEEIKSLEQRRSQIKLEAGIYDIAAQRQAIISQRADAENRLQEARSTQAKDSAKIAYLEAARAHLPATTSSVSTDQNDEAIHARSALIDLQQSEASLAARYGTSNPDLARVRAQIATVRKSVEGTSLSRNKVTTLPSPVRQDVEQQLIALRAELSTSADDIARLQHQAAERGNELARLERADLDLRTTVLRIDVLTDNLKAMQGRYERARAQEQTELARQVSVVQVAGAIASEKPVKPKKLIFALVGVLGSLLAGAAAAVLCVVTNKTAVTEDAAERLLGLPVLAVVPVRGGSDGLATLDFA